MRAVLLDTHAWAWTLTDDQRLSERARAGIEQAGSVLVSPISFFEIAQKVRLGKWPEMEPMIERLPAFLDEQGGSVASLDLVVRTSAGCIGVAAPRPLRSAACGDRVPLQPAHRLR